MLRNQIDVLSARLTRIGARESAESKGGSEPTQAEFFNLPRRRTTGAFRAACLSLSTVHAMHRDTSFSLFFIFCI